MTMATTYISNRPTFWQRVMNTFNIIGYSRAANELTRLGYHAEAKECIMQVKRLREL